MLRLYIQPYLEHDSVIISESVFMRVKSGSLEGQIQLISRKWDEKKRKTYPDDPVSNARKRKRLIMMYICCLYFFLSNICIN